jgi:hypothetical protein
VFTREKVLCSANLARLDEQRACVQTNFVGKILQAIVNLLRRISTGIGERSFRQGCVQEHDVKALDHCGGLPHFPFSSRWPTARARQKAFGQFSVGLLSLNDSWQKVQTVLQNKRAAGDECSSSYLQTVPANMRLVNRLEERIS